jgi:hypothetical protein
MSGNVVGPIKGTGFRPPKRWPTPFEFAQHAVRLIKARAASLPARSVLGTPDIRDQGGAGSCMGFSVAQAIYIDEQADGVANPRLPSPVVPYWFARREDVSSDDDVADTGSDPDMMVRAVNDFGACEWETAPYRDTEVNVPPSTVALVAAQRLVCSLDPILSTGSDIYIAIQHAIAVERRPVVIGFEVGPGYDGVGPDGLVDDPIGPYRGAHANSVFGYDEDGLLVANQWGRGWGRDGCCTMTDRFVFGAVLWAGVLNRKRGDR